MHREFSGFQGSSPTSQGGVAGIGGLLMGISEVHEDLGGRHPLEHETEGLLAFLRLRHVEPHDVKQWVHGFQRWRRAVKAFQPEALALGVGEAIQDVLLQRGDPAFPLPASVGCLFADLDVQHAELLEAVAQISHHQELFGRLLGEAPLHGASGHPGIFQHVAQQRAQAASGVGGEVGTAKLVELDLVPRVTQIFADVIVSRQPLPHRVPEHEAEERSRSAGNAKTTDGQLEAFRVCPRQFFRRHSAPKARRTNAATHSREVGNRARVARCIAGLFRRAITSVA
mmetsp:Transcript_56816/g.164571  ORF Transcript_56816/g.164571 Transcript_56816/m.164571 type:complete len:284 (-) Transcript_56816:959-1810(-)